jgi:glycosyltransferase involved in cell wall biosynthesis
MGLMSKNDLSVLQVSRDDVLGGAEKIAFELFSRYQLSGIESFLAVGRKTTNHRNIVPIPNFENKGLHARIWLSAALECQRLQPRLPAVRHLTQALKFLAEPKMGLAVLSGRQDWHQPGIWHLLDLLPKKPDILHCHNLHGNYFDLAALPHLSQRLPVFLTLHDAWMLTGHCGHSFECRRWQTGCGHCPDLTIYPPIRRDATAYNWRQKAAVYKKSRLFVATPSKWLMRKVEQSMLKTAIEEAQVIYNGVDLNVFKPGSKTHARQRLNLPPDSFIIFFAASQGLSNSYKDAVTLLRVFHNLRATRRSVIKPVLLVLGEKADDVESYPDGGTLIRRAFIANQQDIADFYRAADVFVYPTLADNCPLVVLEALASGLPVVASATGGIPEIIDDGTTGFLVSKGSVKELSSVLDALVADEELQRKVSSEARASALRRFDVNKMSEQYLTWYYNVLRSRERLAWHRQ